MHTLHVCVCLLACQLTSNCVCVALWGYGVLANSYGIPNSLKKVWSFTCSDLYEPCSPFRFETPDWITDDNLLS